MDDEKLDSEQNNRLLDSSNYVDDVRIDRMKGLGLEPKEFYSAMDPDVTFRIYKYLKYRIDKDFSYPYYNIIIPLCLTLMRVHENGVRVDVPYIEKLVEENVVKAEETKKSFFEEAGRTFNLQSVDQLRDFMYNQLKLPKNDKFKSKKSGKPSTDQAAITYYSKQAPILQKILDFRAIQKQTSTYLEGYKKLADEYSRVYPSYLQIGPQRVVFQRQTQTYRMFQGITEYEIW